MLKNNKLLTFLVSFVGTGTLLGTGFGAWVFNENGELNLSHSIDGINVEIATEATLGHFKMMNQDIIMNLIFWFLMKELILLI